MEVFTVWAQPFGKKFIKDRVWKRWSFFSSRLFLIYHLPTSFSFHKYDVREWSDLTIFPVPGTSQYFHIDLPFDKSSLEDLWTATLIRLLWWGKAAASAFLWISARAFLLTALPASSYPAAVCVHLGPVAGSPAFTCEMQQKLVGRKCFRRKGHWRRKR